MELGPEDVSLFQRKLLYKNLAQNGLMYVHIP